MKKFICKKCTDSCVLKVYGDAAYPSSCPYGDESKWHEVKEDTTPVAVLSDWCKVGEWGYMDGKYHQIIEIGEN